MLELPEAQTVARQMNAAFSGKTIISAQALQTPHGFAWFRGDAQEYARVLTGLTVTGAAAYGGRTELHFGDDWRMSFNDGVNARYIAPDAKRPAKHQLLLEFDDGCAMACTVQMYGGFMLYENLPQALEDFYYRVGFECPSPLTDAFDMAYFDALRANAGEKLSLKAFLAAQQRIPGLGNGVLQDILWRAGLHPKRKLSTLSQAQWEGLYAAVKQTLADMTAGGGRSTEKDLYGQPGGYAVILSSKTLALPCPACGGPVARMSYMGGNIYACNTCQKMEN